MLDPITGPLIVVAVIIGCGLAIAGLRTQRQGAAGKPRHQRLHKSTVEHKPILQVDPSKLKDLTFRERQIASLATQGLTNRQIADQLGSKATTVAAHLRSINEKLDVHSKIELTACYRPYLVDHVESPPDTAE